jgi:hypothetical protein
MEEDEKPTMVLHGSKDALLRLYQHGFRSLRVVVGMAAGQGVACDRRWKLEEFLEQQGEEAALELPLDLPLQQERTGWLAVALLVGGKQQAAAAVAGEASSGASTAAGFGGVGPSQPGPSSRSSQLQAAAAAEGHAEALDFGVEDEGFGDFFGEGFGDAGLTFGASSLGAATPGTPAALLGLPAEAGLVVASLPLPLLPREVCEELEGLMGQVVGQGLGRAQAYHMVITPIVQDLMYCLSNAAALRRADLGDALRVQQMLAPVVTSLASYFSEHGLRASLQLLQEEYGLMEGGAGFLEQQRVPDDAGGFIGSSHLQGEHQQSEDGSYIELSQLQGEIQTQQQHRSLLDSGMTAGSEALALSASAGMGQLLLQLAEEVSVAEPASSFSSGPSRRHRRSHDRGARRRHGRGVSPELSAGDEASSPSVLSAASSLPSPVSAAAGSAEEVEEGVVQPQGFLVGWRSMVWGFGNRQVESSYRAWKARLLCEQDSLMLMLYFCTVMAIVAQQWWSGALSAAVVAASSPSASVQLTVLCYRLLYPVCMAAGHLLCCFGSWVPSLAVLQQYRSVLLVGAATAYIAGSALQLARVPGLHSAMVENRPLCSVEMQAGLVIWWHLIAPMLFRVGEVASVVLLLVLLLGQVVVGGAALPLPLLGHPNAPVWQFCLAVVLHMAWAVYLEQRLRKSFAQLRRRVAAAMGHLD